MRSIERRGSYEDASRATIVRRSAGAIVPAMVVPAKGSCE
jgi:hypothetical protein